MSQDQNVLTRRAWWAAAVLALVLLSVAAVWGSREYKHVEDRETWAKEKREITESLHQVEAQKLRAEQAAKDSVRKRTRTVPVLLANGVTAYMTEESVDEYHEATSSLSQDFTSEITALKKENIELLTKTKEHKEVTVKHAPRWAAALDVPVLAYQNVTRWRLGAGMNLGPLTAMVTHPLALTLDPGIQLTIRF